MGAVPKRRISKGRKRRRRAHHGLSTPTLTTCPTCKSKVPTHTVCKTCGKYKGKDVIEL